jgi:hypothetical protein
VGVACGDAVATSDDVGVAVCTSAVRVVVASALGESDAARLFVVVFSFVGVALGVATLFDRDRETDLVDVAVGECVLSVCDSVILLSFDEDLDRDVGTDTLALLVKLYSSVGVPLLETDFPFTEGVVFNDCVAEPAGVRVSKGVLVLVTDDAAAVSDRVADGEF